MAHPYEQRYDFFIRCQDAVDEIVDEIDNGNGLSPRDCMKRFSPEVFLEINNATQALTREGEFSNDTAIRNMKLKQHFIYKGREELRPMMNTKATVFAVVVSLSSLVLSVYVTLSR